MSSATIFGHGLAPSQGYLPARLKMTVVGGASNEMDGGINSNEMDGGINSNEMDGGINSNEMDGGGELDALRDELRERLSEKQKADIIEHYGGESSNSLSRCETCEEGADSGKESQTGGAKRKKAGKKAGAKRGSKGSSRRSTAKGSKRGGKKGATRSVPTPTMSSSKAELATLLFAVSLSELAKHFPAFDEIARGPMVGGGNLVDMLSHIKKDSLIYLILLLQEPTKEGIEKGAVATALFLLQQLFAKNFKIMSGGGCGCSKMPTYKSLLSELQNVGTKMGGGSLAGIVANAISYKYGCFQPDWYNQCI